MVSCTLVEIISDGKVKKGASANCFAHPQERWQGARTVATLRSIISERPFGQEGSSSYFRRQLCKGLDLQERENGLTCPMLERYRRPIQTIGEGTNTTLDGGGSGRAPTTCRCRSVHHVEDLAIAQ